MQENLLKLLMAIGEGNSDVAADLVIHISETTEEFNRTEFRRRTSQVMASRQDQGLQQMNVGKALLEVSKNAAENGLFVPSELTLLGKTLLQLDEVGKILDPEFDPNASIRRNVGALMSQRMLKNATQGSLFSSLLEMKDFVGGLPSRLNNIMDAISKHELEVKIKAVDAQLVMEGFQKIANRITTGIILASIIMGASVLMQVQTSFRIFGYPGLAILCFTAAAAGGFSLVFHIFIKDQKIRKK
jgi:predicted unusual protein kinase regulating ubiquinone biosynthesis (AarF/ABC1/UbiB family)